MSGTDTNKNSRIARNTLFLYIRMFFAMAVTLYTSRVLLKTLGVVDFGVNNVVAGFVTMFSFLNTSLIGSIQRYYNFERSVNGEVGIRNVYRTSMRIQVILSCIVFVLIEGFGVWYLNTIMNIPDDRIYAANILLQSSTISLILLILSVPFSAAIISFEHMDYYAFVGVFDVILKLLIVLVLQYLGHDKLIVYACLLIIVSVSNFILYYVYARRKLGLIYSKSDCDPALMKSMLVFSGWNFFGTFSNVIYQQGINLLLNFYFGPIINAARAIAAYVSNAVTGFSSNIVVAFRPQLVEAYAEHNYSRVKKIMYSESKISYIMLLILIVPLIIEVDFILGVWLGDAPESSGIFTILSLLVTLISVLNIPFAQIVHASGKMKKFQLITGGITCLIIPLGWLGFRAGYSPTSIFVIALFLSVLTQLACIIIVRSIFDYDLKYYIFKVLLPLLVATCVVPIIPWLIISYVVEQSLLRFLLVTTVSTLIIVAYTYFILLNSDERAMVHKLLNKWKRRKS